MAFIPLIQTEFKKEYSPLLYHLYFFALFAVYELLFHALHFRLFTGDTIRILGFTAVLCLLPGTLCGMLKGIAGKICATLFTVFTLILFLVQFIYHSVFLNFFSPGGTLKYANQAADNKATVLSNMKSHPIAMILLLAPAAAGIFILWKFYRIRKESLFVSAVEILCFVILYPSLITTVKISSDAAGSAYHTYRYYPSVDLAVEQLGVCESFLVDIRSSFFSGEKTGSELTFSSNASAPEPDYGAPTTHVHTTTDAILGSNTSTASDTDASETVVAVDRSPNVLDIDFDEIAAKGGSGVARLSEYFKTVSPTRKNEYTGMFEGYNVIWVTAEGFSGYLLKTGLFPTISRMASEGFIFDNYYSPLWYGSTLGGEYANLTGNPSKNGGYLSMALAGANKNDMRFCLANMLNKEGYKCYGFHNNAATYYDRHISHPNLGYEWIANGTGLDVQTDENGGALWPQSDLVMIEDTFTKYSTEEPYHLYYLSVSGHVEYDFSGNDMSKRHKDITEDFYQYSTKTRAYIACQYELELAMSELISELKMNGQYENTVIILAADHVPYNDMDIVDDLSGRSASKYDAYKNTLIIFSGAMEEPVYVNKVCSSIDILPTVLNLLGLPYDSRLISGRDILSDSPGLVFWADQSFLTDDFYYDATTNEITQTNKEIPIDKDTVEYWKSYVADKYTAANGLNEYNYLKYLPEDDE